MRLVRGLARRLETRGRRAVRSALTRTQPIAYGNDARQVLDVMQPRWPAHGERRAVVIFHGGGWREGSRGSMVERVCRRYVERGFVVANVGYRHGLVAASEDAVRALAWVHENLARGVVVTGESAGAHLALYAAFTSPEPVRAAIAFYAPTDLTQFPYARGDRSLPARDPDATLRALSPLAYVRPGCCPVTAIHGTSDPLVPLVHTTRLVRALRDAGVDVEEILVPGGGHGFLPHQLDAVYDRIFERLSDIHR